MKPAAAAAQPCGSAGGSTVGTRKLLRCLPMGVGRVGLAKWGELATRGQVMLMPQLSPVLPLCCMARRLWTAGHSAPTPFLPQHRRHLEAPQPALGLPLECIVPAVR
jgi:hypothetical protein